MSEKYLLLVWEEEPNDRRKYPHLSFDFIPAMILLSPYSEGNHSIAVTNDKRSATVVDANFTACSQGNTSVINYDPKDNTEKDVYPGTLTLYFDSLTKDSLRQVHWRTVNAEALGVCHTPGNTVVNATWYNIDTEKITKKMINTIVENMKWKPHPDEGRNDK